MRVLHLFAAVGIAVAACAGDEATTTTSGSAASDTTVAMSDPTTDPPPATVPGSITVPPTTVPPTTDPPRSGAEPGSSWPPGLVLGAPAPSLLAARPREEIDWPAIGPGWLVVDRSERDQRGLYFVSPDDQVFTASALPADASRIVAVSRDGRVVVLEESDQACADGCSCPDDAEVLAAPFGYLWLDVTTTELRSAIEPTPVSVCDAARFERAVGLSIDGAAIWVRDSWLSEQFRLERVRLTRVELVGGRATTIVDERLDTGSPDSDEPGARWGISMLELDDGLVVATPSGTVFRPADGTSTRSLDVPDTGCQLVDEWDAGRVLARCVVPAGLHPTPEGVPVEQCHPTGLWALALDGSAAQPVAVRLDQHGHVECFTGYAGAERIGDSLALQVGGDGCSDDVDLIAADGVVTRWSPPSRDSCTETLVGQRNGAWLIATWPDHAGPLVVYEVTLEASTPLGLPEGDVIVL